MATKQQLQAVAIWVSKLSLLTTGGKTPPTKQTISLYAEILAGDLPATAFTEASLHEVASGCEYFPAYSVVKTALETWHEAARKRMIASPTSTEFREWLDDREDNQASKVRLEDRLAAAKADWQDPNTVRMSAHRIGDDHPHRMRMGRMLASLVRRHAPENLGYLPPEFLDDGATGS